MFADVIGQPAAVAICRAAAAAAAGDTSVGSAAMAHSWLFTGPPGSGRSVIARAFAAALECEYGGCGSCPSCHTVKAGTHADVVVFAPEGLSIAVAKMREVVQRSASKPVTGRWRIVIIEDADRLSEGASNALLKSVEEPPPHTVYLLCAPSTHPDDVSVTIRSRCRVVNLVSPPADAITDVLVNRDGIDVDTARWAASVCGGHVGRARGLARDPAARDRRAATLTLPGAVRSVGDVFAEAGELHAQALAAAAKQSEDRDESEREALRIAMGAGGTGKGAAAATRGSAGALKALEAEQKARHTRTVRDFIDGALIDLSGFYRDVITYGTGSGAALLNPDVAGDVHTVASLIGPDGALARLEAILQCRIQMGRNVKPELALQSLFMQLRIGRAA